MCLRIYEGMGRWGEEVHGYENIAGVDQFFGAGGGGGGRKGGFSKQPVEMDPAAVVEGGQIACVFFR